MATEELLFELGTPGREHLTHWGFNEHWVLQGMSYLGRSVLSQRAIEQRGLCAPSGASAFLRPLITLKGNCWPFTPERAREPLRPPDGVMLGRHRTGRPAFCTTRSFTGSPAGLKIADITVRSQVQALLRAEKAERLLKCGWIFLGAAGSHFWAVPAERPGGLPGPPAPRCAPWENPVDGQRSLQTQGVAWKISCSSGRVSAPVLCKLCGLRTSPSLGTG